MRKALVIVGPTASGKSALAVALAKKFNGEIISADSRQVYRGLDIGTGKKSVELFLRARAEQHGRDRRMLADESDRELRQRHPRLLQPRLRRIPAS